ncbi:MAG: carbamoyltransferase [Gammaproteobacteria bacterium]|nr:carbamoyltransferase [Gammaproteobacteria bacterium]
MWILGISAFYHDSAAALIHDGEIIAAAQEERFNRKKHYADFPTQAIEYCLREANITLEHVDSIIFYDKPFLKFERLLETYHAFAPAGLRSFITAMPVWLKEKLFQKRLLTQELKQLAPGLDLSGKLLFSEHHLSHAASAFYPSPFDKALILTMDGVGEWATTSAMIGEGREIKPVKEIRFPHSLGLLYSAFTYYTGFKVNSGEYKLMGLAPYGEPVYADLIRQHLVEIADDGSFRLDMRYFNYCTGLTMTNRRFDQLFGRKPRAPETEITQMDMDLARSVQEVTEEIILKLATSLRKEYDYENLCLAGGVALNCVANGKLLRSGLFKNIWIQPAAGDAGGSVGAALVAYHLHHQRPRTPHLGVDGMKGAYLGPQFSNTEIRAVLYAQGVNYQELTDAELIDHAALALSEEKVIGWFQGRMEFGPRALGGRSILGDPRSTRTQSVMNLKIKFRESFRPFAPSVLREDVSQYFELDSDSPYMLLVAPVRQERQRPLSTTDQHKTGLDRLNIRRSDIPAVTHVDYSARIQTVHADTNPRYHALISRFLDLTGYGLVVNTSFNVRGEPIVCTPQDALRCFLRTAMDELYIGNFRIQKNEQSLADHTTKTSFQHQP